MVTEPLEEVLDWARRSMGDRRLIAAVRGAIRTRAAAAALNLDPYLDQHGARNAYRGAISVTEGTIRRIDELARLLRMLGVRIELDLRYAPWDAWRPSSTLAIAYGERHVRIPGVSQSMKQRAVGARDVRAVTNLIGFTRTKFKIDCEVELVPVSTDLSPHRARDRWGELTRRAGIGAIVVVGSPLVNPFADLMAEEICRDAAGTPPNPALLPGRFLWSFARQQGTPPSFLSVSEPCERSQEGIQHRDRERTTKRMHDDDVGTVLRDKVVTDFPDCGLLLMDYRKMRGGDGPLLILAAGHGGCGTLGCIAMLGELAEVAARLSADHRMFEIVRVNRRQPRKQRADDEDLIDDLILDGSPVFASGMGQAAAPTVLLNLT